MKTGSENRNKTIILIVLGVVLLGCVAIALNSLYGGSSASTPAPQPAATATKPESSSGTPTTTTKSTQPAAGGLGAIPGVDAQKLANTSSSLDPTLDQSAMLRTENLVYSGSGRNIFSTASDPPPPPIAPKDVPNPRNNQPTGPPPPPPPPPTCPPSCPPINLKYFGNAQRGNVRQAFLLQGEDVFLASVGDIVAHKYKIVSIEANSIHVEDLSNGNTQTLPLQQ